MKINPSFNEFLTNLKKPDSLSIGIVDDFFNKVAVEIRDKYFPDVKFYRDNKECEKAHYSIELFNNGVLPYSNLIKRLSNSCNDEVEKLHQIVFKNIVLK